MNDNENEIKPVEAEGTLTENNTAENQNPDKKFSAASEIFDYVEIFVLSVCAVMLLFTFAIRLCRVDGESMNNTLIDEEVLIVSDINYTPEVNDIVVFHQIGTRFSSYNKPIVKRVIATAGQFVKIDYQAGILYVSDDNKFDESDIVDESEYIFLDSGRWNSSDFSEAYVPEGYIFVMGDNRNNSADSRSDEIGLVDLRRIIGKVQLRITPFSKAGSVY